MILIVSCIGVSLVLISLLSYHNNHCNQNNQNNQNSDIQIFLLADSVEEEEYSYNLDLI